MMAAISYAQQVTDKDKLIYLDSLNKETTNLNHTYYRVIKDYYTNAEQYKVSDYYKSGKIKNEATVTDKYLLYRTGEFSAYYENGNKWSKLNYVDSQPAGKFFNWYENGNPRTEGEYLPKEKGAADVDNAFRIIQYWNKDNVQKVVDGNGYFSDQNGLISSYGKITDGLKDSIWTGKVRRPKFSFTETYDHGKFISGTSIDSNSVSHPYNKIYVKPSPKKGIEHFYKFVAKKFRMPDEYNGGKIILKFAIEKDGSIADVEIIKSLGHILDDEAIRVIKAYPDWGTGEFRGIKVRSSFSIPITVK